VILLAVAVLLLLALLGAPIFAVIAAAAMLGFYHEGTELSVMGIDLYQLTDSPVLLALPLFAFSGYVLGESHTSDRLVRLAQASVGWLPGGLAMVAFTICAFFTAFTGASGVTIVALGALLYPALTRAGYRDKFALGLVTTSGSLGLLLPPSLPLILYAVIAQQLPGGSAVTFQEIFKAGLLPALLMVTFLSLYGYWNTRKYPVPTQPFDWPAVKAALWEAKWEIPLPLFVLAGIYGGYFAVSEAAAVTALYVVIVEVFIYREVSFRRLPVVMREAMVMVGGVLMILGLAMAFTNWMVDAEIPTTLLNFVKAHVENKYVFLLLLNGFLLVLGMMLDIFSAIVIMVPLLLPLALGYGINPIHFGIIFLANMEIGYSAPPVGLNLSISSFRFRKPITELAVAALPFNFILLLAVLLITYLPWLSLAFAK